MAFSENANFNQWEGFLIRTIADQFGQVQTNLNKFEPTFKITDNFGHVKTRLDQPGLNLHKQGKVLNSVIFLRLYVCHSWSIFEIPIQAQ